MIKVYVRRGGTDTGAADIVLDAHKNLLTGEDDFVKHYKTITTLEADLLLMASSVFAADRCIQRGEREDLTRGIELSIPIINTHYKYWQDSTVWKESRRHTENPFQRLMANYISATRWYAGIKAGSA